MLYYMKLNTEKQSCDFDSWKLYVRVLFSIWLKVFCVCSVLAMHVHIAYSDSFQHQTIQMYDSMCCIEFIAICISVLLISLLFALLCFITINFRDSFHLRSAFFQCSH